MLSELPKMISVGIPTHGVPRYFPLGNGINRLENMLIGKDFHWEKELAVSLPGDLHLLYPDTDCGSTEATEFHLINILPVETYLECVVGSEMNPESPIEFMKAHAIISRSWVMGKILRSHPNGTTGMISDETVLIGWDDCGTHHAFDVCSDDHCQRYQGIQPVSQKALCAIRETAGKVLRDSSGRIIDARFSKCCGGTTELFSTCWQNHEMPGLESFCDPWCDLSNLSDSDRLDILKSILKDYDISSQGGYRWTSEISKEKVSKIIHDKFGHERAEHVGEIQTIEPLKRGPSGRISLLKIIGKKGDLTLGKELWIRRLLSESHLYSSAFEIEDTGDSFLLHGKGWGHGVGLCQIGAARMALEGASYREILSFYYPNTIIC